MKRFVLAALSAATVCAPMMASLPAQAQVSVSFNIFQDGLAPYGNWVNDPNLGQVWVPGQASCPPGWRPYAQGRWVWSPQGFTWVSSEPFGWATYHYGRWAWMNGYGWAWIPGSVWAPAWVSWYSGPGYMGWSPLPPQGYGPPQAQLCCFVRNGAFLSLNLGSQLCAPSQNQVIVRNTTVINNISVVNNVVQNPGPGLQMVQRNCGPVPQVSLVTTNNYSQASQVGAGNALNIYNPRILPTQGVATPSLQAEALHGQVYAGSGNRPLTVAPAPAAALNNNPRPMQSQQRNPNQPTYSPANVQHQNPTTQPGLQPAAQRQNPTNQPPINYRPATGATNPTYHPNAANPNSNYHPSSLNSNAHPTQAKAVPPPQYRPPQQSHQVPPPKPKPTPKNN